MVRVVLKGFKGTVVVDAAIVVARVVAAAEVVAKKSVGDKRVRVEVNLLIVNCWRVIVDWTSLTCKQKQNESSS